MSYLLHIIKNAEKRMKTGKIANNKVLYLRKIKEK